MATYNTARSGENPNGQYNKSYFNRLLRNITNWGMDYDDMLIKNAAAIGKDQSNLAQQGGTSGGNSDPMYDFFARTASSSTFSKKAISYLDTSYPEKKRILREYSRKDEIRDFVTIICDESIVYDDSTDFLFPINLPEEFDENIKKKYLENFHNIYYRLGFNDGAVAWSYFKTLVVDGFLAFEIIYDDKQRDIVGFQELDSTTLVPGIEPTTGDKIWIQFPEQPSFRRILLDSQIIYISYSNGTELSETSYVENLIRPYNQLKLLEQTRIMFNITNAMVYKQFTIPVNGMSKSMAEEQISKMIANYKDEISWNDDFGIVQINGSPHIPYSKEYWFPSSEHGKAEVSLIKQDGHNLNEDDTTMVWFFNALKRASKIPFTRFDKTNGGGNVFGDDSDVSRDEVTFFNFTSRLRAIFKEVLVKPWKIKMVLDFPELKEDENFMQSINADYNGVNLFHEWKKLNNLSKRADILGSLSSSIQSADGTPYFHIEWLVREILKLDEETIQDNARWKKVSPNATAEGGGMDMGGMDMGGMDMGGMSDMGTGAAADTSMSDMSSPAGAGDVGDSDTGGDDFDF
jgi:hypothetical protein